MVVMVNDVLKRWADNWTAADRALKDVRRRELQSMTDEDVRRAIADIFSVPIPQDLPPRTSSGLIEQQRLFARLRRTA